MALAIFSILLFCLRYKGRNITCMFGNSWFCPTICFANVYQSSVLDSIIKLKMQNRCFSTITVQALIKLPRIWTALNVYVHLILLFSFYSMINAFLTYTYLHTVLGKPLKLITEVNSSHQISGLISFNRFTSLSHGDLLTKYFTWFFSFNCVPAAIWGFRSLTWMVCLPH